MFRRKQIRFDDAIIGCALWFVAGFAWGWVIFDH